MPYLTWNAFCELCSCSDVEKEDVTPRFRTPPRKRGGATCAGYDLPYLNLPLRGREALVFRCLSFNVNPKSFLSGREGGRGQPTTEVQTRYRFCCHQEITNRTSPTSISAKTPFFTTPTGRTKKRISSESAVGATGSGSSKSSQAVLNQRSSLLSSPSFLSFLFSHWIPPDLLLVQENHLVHSSTNLDACYTHLPMHYGTLPLQKETPSFSVRMDGLVRTMRFAFHCRVRYIQNND